MISLFQSRSRFDIPKNTSSGNPFSDKTLGLLAQYLSEGQPPISAGKNFGNFIALPSDSEAQYSFHIWSAFGERQIAAVLKNAEEGTHFYHYSFELADFKDDESQLDLRFNAKLELILSHDTRVRQSNGLVWATFRCEYLDDGEWKNLGGAGASLRWANFRIPKAPIYRAVYYRGPKGFSKSNTGIVTRS